MGSRKHVLAGGLFLSIFFLGVGCAIEEEGTVDCRQRGGVFVEGGRLGDNLCVKDGLIVAVYH